MSNFLPDEYELRANYYALAMAINEDFTPDVAMNHMRVEPEKARKEGIYNSDMWSMLRMQKKEGKSLDEIAECFNIDKDILKVKLTKFINKYVKDRKRNVKTRATTIKI